ncbi:MAG: hypothetical protein Q8R32_03095 [bacterium]|nr:hypothetical protein [bacterium]
MSTTTTLTTSRDPKGLKFMATVEAAYNKAGLDDERAQRLNESPEVVDELRTLIERFSATNQFANEEVPSTFGYLSGYQPKSVAEQVKRLRELFPELGTVNEQLAEQPLPPNAEGFFVIPRWEKIAKTYGEAVEKVLALIEKTRNGKFTNYRKGELGPQYLRQHARTVTMFQKLSDAQKGHDMLVIPAQFGLRHRGRSVRRAREVFLGHECGLGAFAIGIMLLTHPERLQHLDDLLVDCAGDEYAPGADGGFCAGRRSSGSVMAGSGSARAMSALRPGSMVLPPPFRRRYQFLHLERLGLLTV